MFVSEQFFCLHCCRPSGEFQPFESAAAAPVPPMQASPFVPVATSVPANITSPSNVDLLDLDLLPPSMSLSMPVQPQSFTAPPAAAQFTMLDMTVSLSSEPAVTISTLQPIALSTSTLVPDPALITASPESLVCTLSSSCGFPTSVVALQ